MFRVFRLVVVCCRSGFLFVSSCEGSAGSSPGGGHRLDLLSQFIDKIRPNVDFICIFADIFVTLQYKINVISMFESDYYQDDFLEAMDALVDGVNGSLFRVDSEGVNS